MATSGARKTPRGARPNRRGGLAQPVCKFTRRSELLRPSGRLLESRSDSGPRGMIIALHIERILMQVRITDAQRTESGLLAHPPNILVFGICATLRSAATTFAYPVTCASNCLVIQRGRTRCGCVRGVLRRRARRPPGSGVDGTPELFSLENLRCQNLR